MSNYEEEIYTNEKLINEFEAICYSNKLKEKYEIQRNTPLFYSADEQDWVQYVGSLDKLYV